MHNVKDIEPDPPYDPDDWGAPPPKSAPDEPQTPESFAPRGPREHISTRDECPPPILKEERLQGRDARSVEKDVHAGEQMTPPAATKPSPRRRGPARVVARGPAVRLPHATKLDLIPAIFSRSALFRVGGSDEAPTAASPGAPAIAIETQHRANMTLAGPWPRMRDKAVWEVALQMAKESADAAAPIRVNLSEFASRLGYVDKGGATLRWIWSSLRRLSLCHVEFNAPTGTRLAGNLLAAAREQGGRKEIQIDPAFASGLLREDYQFAINRARRAQLSTALARWMHDFLSTHATQDQPFDLSYFRPLCGYGADKRRFPAELEAALADLAKTAPEILESYSFTKGTRSSEEWTVALVCGGETRRFEQPIRARKPVPAARPSGRGSVAL